MATSSMVGACDPEAMTPAEQKASTEAEHKKQAATAATAGRGKDSPAGEKMTR